MKTITLTKYDVEIKENNDLTYGDIEDIQLSLMGAVNMSGIGELQGVKPEEMKGYNRKVAERVIEKITDKEGKEIKFSNEWMEGIKPANDGMKLMNEINKETQNIGKKK